MKLTLILLFLTIFPVLTQANNEKLLDDLIVAGEYQVFNGLNTCENRGTKLIVSHLGEGCFKIKELPTAVKSEVSRMKDNELENESEYDQRVTEILTIRTAKKFELKDILNFSQAINIPSDQLRDHQISEVIASEEIFEPFNDLFLTFELSLTNHVRNYLHSEYFGRRLSLFKANNQVMLYPGGGFNVSHFFFIMDGQITYLKLSWWNS